MWRKMTAGVLPIKLISVLAIASCTLFIPTGCAGNSPAALGDTVKIDFTLWLEDGTVYYSTSDTGPLEYTLGTGSLIQGAEEAIVGMKAGETKEATITPDKAFGDVQPGLIQTVRRSLMPEGFVPEAGKMLNTTVNGQTMTVLITQVTDDSVTVDGNNLLAGQTIKLQVKLLSLNKLATPSQTILGQPLIVWILSSGLIVLLAAFSLFYILTQQRLKKLEYAALPRRRRME